MVLASRATRRTALLLAVVIAGLLPGCDAERPNPPATAPTGSVSPGASPPGGSRPVDAERAAALQAALESAREAAGVPGVQAAIVFGDGTSWTGAAGVSAGDHPMTPELLMDIASVSKVYTSTLILRLAELGVVSLDDPVTRWVPDAPNAGGVTLRQLMTHTSGIASDDAALPTVCDPGACYSYSNAGYQLLGRVVESATGGTFARALRSQVLQPGGLEATFYPREEAVSGEPAMGRADGAEESALEAAMRPAGPGWLGASGGIVATATDMARFGHALFTGSLVSEASVGTITDVDVTVGLPGTSDCHAHAMVDRRSTPFGQSFAHGGFAGSFRAWLEHYDSFDLTIAVTVNSGAFPAPVADALVAVALGGRPLPAAPGHCEDAIAIRSADGTVIRLPDEPGFDGTPAWSPDGRSLAWVVNRRGSVDLVVGDQDGGSVRALTNDAALDVRPGWSPDGTRIVFSSDRDGDHELYVMRVSDGSVTQITHNDVDDWVPSWSPDGSSIAFVRTDGSNELRLISPDGGSDRAVAGPDGGVWWPAWAPDGTLIAYESGGVIWLVPAHGGQPERLAVERLRVVRLPAWAPSADLVFSSDADLYAAAPDGSNLRRLTSTPTEESAPAWGPDGASLVFTVSFWVGGA